MGAFWHVTAVAEATWGITGPVFLQFYIPLCLVVLVIVALAHRANGQLGPLRPLPLTPWQVAVFSNDAATMKGTVLAELYAAGLLNDNGELARHPQPQERLSPPAMAVYQHLVRQPGAVSDEDFLRLPGIEEQVAASRELLGDHGYLTPVRPAARRRAMFADSLFSAVFWLGALRAFLGSRNDQPTLWLTLTTCAYLLAGFGILPVRRGAGRPTKKGRRALAAMRGQYSSHDPRQGGLFTSGGPPAMSMTVAMFGIGAMYCHAPAAAQAMGQITFEQAAVTNPGSFGSDSSSGSSCRSGDGCGSGDGGCGGCGGWGGG